MSLYIKNEGLVAQVQQDLRTILPDPGMTFNLEHGFFTSIYKVDINRTPNSIAGQIITALITSPIPVTIEGQNSDFPIPTKMEPTRILSNVGGSALINQYPATSAINIRYDCQGGAGCSGRGYYALGSMGEQIDSPTDVILFHELIHAFHAIVGGFSGGVATAEVDVLAPENLYRSQRKVPTAPRVGHGGGCKAGPPAKPDSTGSSKSKGKKGCFIATASLENTYEDRLDSLRYFRDHIVRQTKRGTRFFEQFYSYYSQYAPWIAEEIRSDRDLKAAITGALILPCINYLQMAIDLPEGSPPDDLSSEWQSFVLTLVDGIESWACLAMPPLVDFPGDHSTADRCNDIAFVLRYVLRSSDRRKWYLNALGNSSQFQPIFGSEEQLVAHYDSKAELYWTELKRYTARSESARIWFELASSKMAPYYFAVRLAAQGNGAYRKWFLTAFQIPLVNYLELFFKLPTQTPLTTSSSTWETYLKGIVAQHGELGTIVDPRVSSSTESHNPTTLIC